MSPVRLRNSKPAAGKADKRAALAARRNGTFFAAELDCFSRGKHKFCIPHAKNEPNPPHKVDRKETQGKRSLGSFLRSGAGFEKRRPDQP